MTNFDTVGYERDGALAIITINRPEAMNSFNAALRRDLRDACRLAADDDSIRAVVLTGAGRSFSAGADLKDRVLDGPPVALVLQNEYRPIFDAVADMPKPVIAAVGGSAAGIGMSLALHCDLLIMADDAFLLSPFTTISLVPDGGLNWLLVHQLGYRRAFQLSVESERIPANRCVELGLANRAVPAAALMDEATQWAHRLAERAPLSVAATKKVMRQAASGSWAATFDAEAPIQNVLTHCEDSAEGVAAFLEKRKPEFKGK